MELPLDKEYHLFLSHSSLDEADVIPILELLESEPYNLKCYIDRRDFMAGETTMANINHAFQKSAATVFFLTPNFIESSYCNHEKDIAYSMFMEGGGRVIPVILKPCCLPDEFRNIHYIDDSFTDSIAEKIFKCLTTGNDKINGSQFTFNMLDSLEKNDGSFISTAVKLQFQRIGIQQPTDEKLLMIMSMLQCLPVHKMAYKLTSITTYMFWRPFLWILACAVVCNLLIQIMEMWQIFNNVQPYYTTIITAIGSIPAVFLIWFITAFVLASGMRMETRTSKNKIRLVNKLAVTDICCYFNLEFTPKEGPQFSVIKYDIAECKKYMKGSWSEKYTDDFDGYDFEGIWNDIVNKIGGVFDAYFILAQKKLPLVEENRHFVKNNKACFCEYFDKVTSFEKVCNNLDAMKRKRSAGPQNQEEEMTNLV